MCFSSTASFITAGLTGTIGIVSLSRVSDPRQILLAATPLFFAVQQSIEGRYGSLFRWRLVARVQRI